GGVALDHGQQVSARHATGDTAAAVAAAVGDAVRADLDFTASVGALVATSPSVTNTQLRAWSDAAGVRARYPGTAGFIVAEQVTAAQLPGFEAAVQADPPAGVPVSPFTVFPPGQRARYCLIRYVVQYVRSPLPAGIDLCSMSSAALDRTTSTGLSTLLPFRSLLGQVPKRYVAALDRALRGLFITITPLYRGGVAPATAAGRVATATGWSIGTFEAGALLRPAVGDASELQASLQFRPAGGSWGPVGAAGTTRGPVETSVVRVSGGPSFDEALRVVVARSAPSTAFGEGLLVGGAGSVVSILLFGFFVFLATSRRRAMRLVEQRTAELRHQALHDALTGLPNRALLFDRAQQLLLRARRHPMAVGALYVDLDNFKDVNDTFGHHTGDQLLKAVAARLDAALRANDTVGRLGGDEFLVLVEGTSLDAGPELVAERLQAVLAEPFVLDTPEATTITVHASIGAAVGLRESANELIRDADVALYAAKAAGRDRVVVFEPEMQTAVQDRLSLEMDLQHAIDHGELFVLYQPIFDLRSVAAKGVEALVRWRHPTRGVVAPDDFIPMAEETGLVVPLGRFVLDEACRQAAAWRADGYAIDVAVNVSARQLENEHFPEEVRRTLDRHHLPAPALTLEITETTIMKDTEATAGVLALLKQFGVRIAIDDFGTGYSSLAYLRNFPIDALKIDRSFITRVSQTEESAALIHTLIQLGKALGIETLAEGVEERAQLATLQREQCDSGQGFLFGRPLDPDTIEGFFTKVPSAADAAAARR
ncbi:MAG: putative bifunctional diguanylate cyclase/phosphodiesterase, partial [Acidimicrobiales bacterium]